MTRGTAAVAIGSVLILTITLSGSRHRSSAESRLEDEPTAGTHADITALRE